MVYVVAFACGLVALVAAFVAGVLFGRKNVKKVEAVVAVAKDPKSLL